MSKMYGWEYYNKHGSNYLYRFIQRNPEFDNKDFLEYVEVHNRGDRDSGELGDVAKHEVLRLAAEFEEKKWRFQNVYGDAIE